MPSKFGTKIREKLIELGEARSEEIVGCTIDEIKEVKTAQNIAYLPPLYEDFLLTMGRFAGKLYLGSDWYYPNLLKLKRYAHQLLEENDKPFVLPEDAFVFLMHQGYQFMWFLTNTQNSDPEVYGFDEMEFVEMGSLYQWTILLFLIALIYPNF